MIANSRVLVAITAVLVATPALAAPCEQSTSRIERGTDADLIICGESVPVEIGLDGLEAAQVTLTSLQSLGRCDVTDRRRGFHLVLTTTSPAPRVQITVRDQATDEAVCELDLEVVDAPEPISPTWLNAMPPGQARYVDVDGIRTRYFEAGTGSPLVLVHGGQAGGSNNSAEKWEQNFPGLARHYRVIALDRLAQAGTGNLADPADYAGYYARDAEHLAAFLDVLGLDDVTLVGHSQGGWPVTRVALDRPELVSCLVNVDTVMVPNDMALMRESVGFLMYLSRYLHPESGPTFYSARRGMKLRYPSGNNITAAKAQRIVDQYHAPQTREAAAYMAELRMTPLNPIFAALKEGAYTDIAAGKLRAKSVLIWGAQDPQVPLGLGQLFQDFLVRSDVDSRLVSIPGAGHAPFVEFPETFERILLGQCPPQAAPDGSE